MKTTNYEISKKLAEIGFKGDAVYYYRKDEPLENQIWHLTELQFEGIDNHYPAFFLETILEALPNYTITKEGEIVIYFDTSRKFDKIVYAEKQEDESLADTAARLLILLHEKGIMKFGKQNVRDSIVDFYNQCQNR